MHNSLSESALRGPDGDLLGFAGHARELASHLNEIELPFTAAVYGSWGAGKTSFTNMLIHELRGLPRWAASEPIRFTAWPYVTADLIWQAMVERIAHALCGQPDLRSADDETLRPWRKRLRDQLLTPALTLRPATVDPQHERYRRLVNRLTIAAGIASRTATERSASLSASGLLRTAVEAAATVSPSAGPLRQLFTGTQERATPPSLVQSVEEVRLDFQQILDDAKSAPLIVLIDDLDRCMPEVALDVLETMKIFFFESIQARAQCLFLVAADESLVSRGLAVRLGDSAHGATDDEARAYLEKIIQFGVPLPKPSAAQINKLVASCGPGWASSSDLILAALDRNPRRVKQQSALLTYRLAAAQTAASPSNGANRIDLPALHKLTQLHAMAPDALATIRSATSRTDLKQWLRTHESMSTEDGSDGAEGVLADLLRTRADVRTIFCGEPLLSVLDQHALQFLALNADLHPGPDGTPRSADPTFEFVARTFLAEYGTTTAESLGVKYTGRLLKLKESAPALVTELARLEAAGYDTYLPTIVALDHWLDQLAADPKTPPSPRAGNLPAYCRALLDDESARTVLYEPPRISEIPSGYLRAVSSEVGSPVTRGSPDLFLPILMAATGIFSAAANIVMSNRQLSADARLRIELARDAVERRRFVKTELLFLRWPDVAQWIHGPATVSRLHDLESRIVGDDREVKLPASLEKLATDDRLREFLAMPPSLGQGPHAPVADSIGTPPSAADQDRWQVPYLSIMLRIEPLGPKRLDGTLSAQLTVDGVSSQVDIPVGKIADLARPMFVSGTGSGGQITRDLGPPSLSMKEVLSEIGSLLWNSTFGRHPALADRITGPIAGADPVRLAITGPDSDLTGLPWECLYLPSHRVFAGQTLKMSIVHGVDKPVRLAEPRLADPVRILLISASPAAAPLPGAAQEPLVLAQALTPAVEQGAVRVETLVDATRGAVTNALRSYAPHIVHFVGHGVVENGNGYLVLLDEAGGTDAVAAEEFGLMLQDHGIALVVLNGCLTGSNTVRDLAAGVAQLLVRQGVPAVIATTRNVADVAALVFASEFYRSFAIGYPAEAALVEARKALALKGWDWSTYVMYADLRFSLEQIRAPVARTQHP